MARIKNKAPRRRKRSRDRGEWAIHSGPTKPRAFARLDDAITRLSTAFAQVKLAVGRAIAGVTNVVIGVMGYSPEVGEYDAGTCTVPVRDGFIDQPRLMRAISRGQRNLKLKTQIPAMGRRRLVWLTVVAMLGQASEIAAKQKGASVARGVVIVLRPTP